MARKSRGHGIIRGRKAPRIQLCPTCGCMRVHHPGAAHYDCPVPNEVIPALTEFKRAHGLRWKAALRNLWLTGRDEGALRQARNMIGPNRIDKIRLED